MKKPARKKIATPRGAKRALARRWLRHYCRLSDPSAYREDRAHLVILCNTIDDFLNDRLIREDGRPYDRLMMNLPPRHFKTYTLINAVAWTLGRDPSFSVIAISYSETLSSRFSSAVRDKISLENYDPDKVFFTDVFDAKIKQGDASKKLWSLEGSHLSYLGASLRATLTGVGCKLGIIDDIVKNVDEALNDALLDQLYFQYANTFLSRLEEGAKQIVNMTRWSENDLCGRLLKDEPGMWYQLKMPAVIDYDKEEMLCESVLSFDSFITKTRIMDDGIVAANYQQNPVPTKGLCYPGGFKEYEELPEVGEIMAYVDTADEGNDYLAAFIFLKTETSAYILDIMYDDGNAEEIERDLATRLENFGVTEAVFESNNGGKAYARIVSSYLETNYTTVSWFHQSHNKQARIISNAKWIQQNAYFPKHWSQIWPEVFNALHQFKKVLKANAHDDAPDGLTGVAELCNDKIKTSTLGNEAGWTLNTN